jgi:hypothetical protein
VASFGILSHGVAPASRYDPGLPTIRHVCVNEVVARFASGLNDSTERIRVAAP